MIDLRPHNKEVFKKVLEAFEKDNKVALVQATGTGKTYVIFALIEHLFKNIKNVLFIEPTLSIIDLIQLKIDFKPYLDKITFTTYSSLKKYKGHHFDLVITDELHRAGATTWEPALRDVNYDKLFGTSATPIRYLDNHRDMTEILFDGNVVEGPDIFYAVENNILPKFTYITALFNEVEMLKQLKEVAIVRKNDEVLKKIDKLVLEINDENVKNKKIIQDAINSNNTINKRHQKWIVFFKTIQELYDYADLMKFYFNADKISMYHSGLSDEKNKQTLFEFEYNISGINVLLAVDAISEGIHVHNLDGILMLRKTISPIIFNQQLGRALSNSNIDKHPIIFDFVGNYLHIEKGKFDYNRWSTKEEHNIILNYIDRFRKINGIIFKDYNLNFNEVIKALKRSYEKWSEDDIKILKKNYPTLGTNIPELRKKFSKSNILRKASELKLKNPILKNKWSENDIKILEKYFPTLGTNIPELRKKFSIGSIRNKAYRLKISFNKNSWSENDIKILEKYFPTLGTNIPELRKKFSKDSIASKASSLNIKSSRKRTYIERNNSWTENDIKILEKYFPTLGTNIPELLIKFEKSNIRAKASILNIKYNNHSQWLKKDIDELVEFYPLNGSNISSLRKKFSREQICDKAKYLGIKKIR